VYSKLYSLNIANVTGITALSSARSINGLDCKLILPANTSGSSLPILLTVYISVLKNFLALHTITPASIPELSIYVERPGSCLSLMACSKVSKTLS
jgi:hypothetical protein